MDSFKGLVCLRDKLYHNVVINDLCTVNIQVTSRQCNTFHCLPQLLKIVYRSVPHVTVEPITTGVRFFCLY